MVFSVTVRPLRSPLTYTSLEKRGWYTIHIVSGMANAFYELKQVSHSFSLSLSKPVLSHAEGAEYARHFTQQNRAGATCAWRSERLALRFLVPWSYPVLVDSFWLGIWYGFNGFLCGPPPPLRHA